MASQLYEPYRCSGVITSETRAHIQKLGVKSYITTSVGRAYQVYDTSNLRLKFVSGTYKKPIRCMISHRDVTYVASGKKIYICTRAATAQQYVLQGHTAPISHMLVFGSSYIVSVDEKMNLLVWDVCGRCPTADALVLGDADDARITCMLHPDTYVNKILLGHSDGRLRLWNFSRSTLLYSFAGWQSPVCCLEQAPALDCIAVGLEDGRVIIHNIREDRTLIVVKDVCAVTGVSFRTDNTATRAIMVTSNVLGHLCVWDLDNQKLLSIKKEAHDGSISTLHFLPSEPVCITTGNDNSIKIWIFDKASDDGYIRLLRERSGHRSPPSHLQFYGPEGQRILTSSRDGTLREASLIQDHRSRQFSSKKHKRPLSAILSMSSQPIREKEWDNILTVHAGSNLARTWRYTNKVLGAHSLQADSNLRSSAISSCGNFVVCGSVDGTIYKWNLQSGFSRGSVSDAHEGAIDCIAINILSSFVISAGHDGYLRKWALDGLSLLDSIDLGSPCCGPMVLHREAGLLGIVLESHDVLIIDSDSFRRVRCFTGHSDTISSLCFSGDGRWVVSGSADSTIRTWDIISSQCLDIFRVPGIPSALAFSPTNDMLVTAFQDRLGLYLWSNKSHYSEVFLKPIPDDPSEVMALPGMVAQPEHFFVASEEETYEKDENALSSNNVWDFLVSADHSDLVSLSGAPVTKWMNFFNMDEVKKRNKPVLPPKAPERAPFFLDTVPGLELTFARKRPADELEQEDDETTNPANQQHADERISDLLEAKSYSDLLPVLENMSAAAVDLHVRLLEAEQLPMFIDFLCHHLQANKHFELVQGYLHCFLKAHSDILATEQRCKEKLALLAETHHEAWGSLGQQVSQALSLVCFFSKRLPF